MSLVQGKETDVLNEPKPPERDEPVWRMTPDQLSDYRRALIDYLGRAPESEPRYMEMCARLTDVIAERQIRKVIENFDGRTGAEPGRPPARNTMGLGDFSSAWPRDLAFCTGLEAERDPW